MKLIRASELPEHLDDLTTLEGCQEAIVRYRTELDRIASIVLDALRDKRSLTKDGAIYLLDHCGFIAHDALGD